MAKKNPLDAYKMPKSVSEGVEIPLEDAPEVVCVVKLPTTYNKPFRSYIMDNLKVGPSGMVEQPLHEVDQIRREGFLETCLVMISVEGVPVADPKAFFVEYPIAEDEVFANATKMAKELEEKTEDKAKKPKPAYST